MIVAFEAQDPIADVAEARRNPFLSRDDMRAVMARSLELYQGRNGGNPPSGFHRAPSTRASAATRRSNSAGG